MWPATPHAHDHGMSETTVIDPTEVEEFAGKILSIYSGAMLNYMIDIGHRTSLFSAAAAGPATSEGLADRAGLTERYVREWLAALVTSGIIEYDPTTKTYTLPPAHAAVLTDGPMNLAPMAALGTHLGKHVHQVTNVFRQGRWRSVRAVPPRVHGRDGRREPRPLRRTADRRLSPLGPGPDRAASPRHSGR